MDVKCSAHSASAVHVVMRAVGLSRSHPLFLSIQHCDLKNKQISIGVIFRQCVEFQDVRVYSGLLRAASHMYAHLVFQQFWFFHFFRALASSVLVRTLPSPRNLAISWKAWPGPSLSALLSQWGTSFSNFQVTLLNSSFFLIWSFFYSFILKILISYLSCL